LCSRADDLVANALELHPPVLETGIAPPLPSLMTGRPFLPYSSYSKVTPDTTTETCHFCFLRPWPCKCRFTPAHLPASISAVHGILMDGHFARPSFHPPPEPLLRSDPAPGLLTDNCKLVHQQIVTSRIVFLTRCGLTSTGRRFTRRKGGEAFGFDLFLSFFTDDEILASVLNK
jgi:hypothetical protein